VTPLLLVIPALLLLSWLIIGDALRPLYRIGRVVETRSPEDLSPIGGQDAPREIRPLVGAIDRLLERLRQALERERRFTADAAHELRTPLAALKAQAEVAQRARDPRERTNALRQIDNGVERTTHLIEQLLTLARLEPDSNEALKMRPISLCPLIEDAVANLFPNALRKHIDLGLQSCGCDGKPVLGNATTLGILLCNLIGNAIRYTPKGGRIDIRTHLDAGRVSLEVADTGPGIPPQQRKRVFERFYRANEHRKTDGSGLGLSIVARIVELHGAEITLSETSDSGGLTVAVAFPHADSGGIDASRGQKKEPAGERQARKRYFMGPDNPPRSAGGGS
jgi:signal transduction histidine kinase